MRVAAFAAAFAAAVSLVVLFTPPGPPPSARPAFALSENLDTTVGLISLDREAGLSYTRLNLRHVGGSLPPERLWVRTYFFVPGDYRARVWAGDAVEIVRPFDGRGNADITVAADSSWCYHVEAPRSGYFARVQVSESREEAALTPLSRFGERFDDPATAAPVVVHAEHGGPFLRR